MPVSAWWLLFCGALVICGTLGISLYLRTQIHKLPCHKSMLDVAEIIFQTCKTYLIQQGKFLAMLFVLIAVAISYYLLAFGQTEEHVFTDRTVQELRLYPTKTEQLSDTAIAALESFKDKPLKERTFHDRTKYLQALQKVVG